MRHSHVIFAGTGWTRGLLEKRKAFWSSRRPWWTCLAAWLIPLARSVYPLGSIKAAPIKHLIQIVPDPPLHLASPRVNRLAGAVSRAFAAELSCRAIPRTGRGPMTSASARVVFFRRRRLKSLLRFCQIGGRAAARVSFAQNCSWTCDPTWRIRRVTRARACYVIRVLFRINALHRIHCDVPVRRHLRIIFLCMFCRRHVSLRKCVCAKQKGAEAWRANRVGLLSHCRPTRERAPQHLTHQRPSNVWTWNCSYQLTNDDSFWQTQLP